MLESTSSSVFDCPICLTRYNEKQNRPMGLPCGHVYCLDCLDKITKCSPSDLDDAVTLTDQPSPYIECPQDKKVHHGDAHSLQCCYAILCNLPNGQTKGYSSFKNSSHNPVPRKESKPRYVQCSRHPGKKVRYFCESCLNFPCADCITDHSGSGHHFSSFLMTVEKKRKDFEEVYRQFKMHLEEARGETGALESAKTKVSLDYEQEMRKLDNAYERAVAGLKEQRKVYSQQLKQDFTRRKKRVEAEESKLKRQITNLERSFMDLRLYDKEGRVSELVDYERFYKLMTDKTTELKTLGFPKGIEFDLLLRGKISFKGKTGQLLERVKGCVFEFGQIMTCELEKTLKKSPDSRFSKSTGKYEGAADRYASQKGTKETSSGKIAKICRRCYRPLKEEGFCANCNEVPERVSEPNRKKSGKRYENVVQSPHDRRISPYGCDQNSRFNQSKRSPPRGYSNQRKKQMTADKYARIYEESQELKESGAMTHRGDFRESYFEKGAMKQIPSDQCLKKGEELIGGGFFPPPPTLNKHKTHHRKGSSLAYYDGPPQYNVFESTILNRVIREQERYEADVNQTAPYGDEEDLIMNNTLDEKPQGEEEEHEIKGGASKSKIHQIHAKPRSNPKLKHFMQQANKRKKKTNKNRARSLETPI